MMRVINILALSFTAPLLCPQAKASQIWTAFCCYNNVYVESVDHIFKTGTSDYLAYCAYQVLESSGLKGWDIYIDHVGWPPNELVHIPGPLYVIYDTAFMMDGHPLLTKPRKTIIICRNEMYINVPECLRVIAYSIDHLNDTGWIHPKEPYHYGPTRCDTCPQYLVRPDTIPAISEDLSRELATKKIYPSIWHFVNKAGIDVYLQDNRYHFYKPTKKPVFNRNSVFHTPVYTEISGKELLTTSSFYRAYEYNDTDMLIFESPGRFYHLNVKDLSVKGPFERNIFLYAGHKETPEKDKLIFYDAIGYQPHDFSITSVYDKSTGKVSTDYIVQVWQWFSTSYMLPFLKANIQAKKEAKREPDKITGYSLIALLILNTVGIAFSQRK